jgi:LysM repeat protein
MASKKKGSPGDRQNRRTSDESELVSLSRGLSNGKPSQTGAILNQATLSVWAATFILVSVLVFGLYQVRDRLDGIQAALEESEQDKKLLLEGMDELLTRADRPNQLLAKAETPAPETRAAPSPPASAKKPRDEPKETEKEETNDLSRKYKIYYRAKEGEDLAGIGEKFHVSVDQLRLWNALKPTESLLPGQVLVINKSTQTDKPVIVAKAPPPPKPAKAEKKVEARAAEEPKSTKTLTDTPAQTKTEQEAPSTEERDIDETGTDPGTAGSVAAADEEAKPETTEPLVEEPVDETLHVVQAGESLSTIGQRYGVSWLALAALNGIEPPGTIYVGQRLAIPEVADLEGITVPTPEVTHRVQRGENLYRIGRRYDLSWKQLARANGITDPSQLYEGQILKIPVASGGPEN